MIQKRLPYGYAFHGYIKHGLVVHREGNLPVSDEAVTHISDSITRQNAEGDEIVLLDFVHHSTDAIRRSRPRPKWFVQSHVLSLRPICIMKLLYTLSNAKTVEWRQIGNRMRISRKQTETLKEYL